MSVGEGYYDPWDDVIDALDTGRDPLEAQDDCYSAAVEYTELRQAAVRAAEKRRQNAEYMRGYRKRKKRKT